MQNQKAKRDMFAEVTNAVIAALETGVAPWQPQYSMNKDRPTINVPFPRNHQGKGYTGINVMILMTAAFTKGYKSAFWLTQDRAEALGGKVRADEKTTTVVRFRIFEQKNPDTGKLETFPVYLPGCELYNVDQIDFAVMPKRFLVAEAPKPKKVRKPAAPKRDADLDAFFDRVGYRAINRTCHHVPHYDIARDAIWMPPFETFHHAQGYYGTLSHELVHWTMAPNRLNRRMDTKDAKRNYALEELVAELGACFLGGELGFSPLPTQNNVAYLDHWIAVLRENKRVIFTVASKAQHAANFVTKAGEEKKTKKDEKVVRLKAKKAASIPQAIAMAA